MAKIKLANFIVGVSGKIAGTIYSHNKGGNYAKTWRKPTQPNSPAQQALKSAFGSFAQNWRTLTQSQRDDWSSLAANGTIKNTLGENVKLSGSQLYSSRNNQLNAVGAASIDDAPPLEGVPAVEAVSLTAAEGAPTLSIAFNPSVPADTSVIVDATNNLSPGISSPGTAFRQIAVLPAADVTPTDILAAWQAIFGGVPLEGQKIFVRLTPVNTNTGEVGISTTVYDIVAA